MNARNETNSTSGVYAIVNNLDGNSYIGSSNNISKRRSCHISQLKAGKHYNARLQGAWNLYGSDAFEFIVLYHCPPDDLIRVEQIFLNGCRPEYNIDPSAIGGALVGHYVSEETRRKIGIANKRHATDRKKKVSLGIPEPIAPAL